MERNGYERWDRPNGYFVEDETERCIHPAAPACAKLVFEFNRQSFQKFLNRSGAISESFQNSAAYRPFSLQNKVQRRSFEAVAQVQSGSIFCRAE
jgi:hypothetical protein